MDTLYLVVPCYNEKEVIYETSSRLLDKLEQLKSKNIISKNSKIMFVDDGSKDNTWEIISELHNKNESILGLKLSRNRGHQNALLAGLMYSKNLCDICISLDADLQDDINAIDEFIKKYNQGYQIVYGVRSSRKKDTFFKKNTALIFYNIMKLLGVDLVYNHADYRLMSKNALEALSNFKEVNLFLRGIVPLIGYKYTTVEYVRNERFAGESKYPFNKMLSFAIDGITSFSIKPIRIIFNIGVIIFIISILALIYTITSKLLGYAVPGWSTVVASIWLIGGIQLLCIGIIGEYIGKIYNEVKNRPRFIIDEFLNQD